MKPDLRELTEMSILAALTFGGKVAMASLPNIEPVSLMIMLMTVIYDRKALYPIYVYVMLEMLVYGFNLWNLVYLYIWLFLAVPAYFMRPVQGRLPWAILSGAFGLLFGLLCIPVYGAVGGWHMVISTWISGIPYDLVHGVSNFLIALAAFVPLRRLLEKLRSRSVRV